MHIQAVILTGGRDSHRELLSEFEELQSKTLLPIHGKPMLAYILDAVTGSGYSPEPILSATDPAVVRVAEQNACRTLPGADSAVSSMLGALHSLPEAEWVLFISGDHALLTTEMLDHFIQSTVERKLALSAAVISQHTIQQAYPDSRRTYFQAKGGAYTGGNLFMIHQSTFRENTPFMEAIDQNRKRPWKSIFLLDPWSAILILARQLTIHEAMERASRQFGCPVGVVEMPFAECGMDVDKPSDRVLAEAILAKRHAIQSTLTKPHPHYEERQA